MIDIYIRRILNQIIVEIIIDKKYKYGCYVPTKTVYIGKIDGLSGRTK